MDRVVNDRKVSMWVFYDSFKMDYKCYSGNNKDYWDDALPKYVLENWFSGARYELIGCYNVRRSKKEVFRNNVKRLDGKLSVDVKSHLEKLCEKFN